jgi:hypothetical protein
MRPVHSSRAGGEPATNAGTGGDRHPMLGIAALLVGVGAFIVSAAVGGGGSFEGRLIAGLLNPLFLIGVPLGIYWLWPRTELQDIKKAKSNLRSLNMMGPPVEVIAEHDKTAVHISAGRIVLDLVVFAFQAAIFFAFCVACSMLLLVCFQLLQFVGESNATQQKSRPTQEPAQRVISTEIVTER